MCVFFVSQAGPVLGQGGLGVGREVDAAGVARLPGGGWAGLPAQHTLFIGGDKM